MIETLLTSWWTLFLLLVTLVYSAQVLRETDNNAGAKIVFACVLLVHIGIFGLAQHLVLETRPRAFVTIQWYTTGVLVLCIVSTVKWLAEDAIERSNRKSIKKTSPFVTEAQLFAETAHYARIFHNYIRQHGHGQSTITIKDAEELLLLAKDALSLPTIGQRTFAMNHLRKLIERDIERGNYLRLPIERE